MALFRKFFYRKPPDGLLEIAERVYVFDCCFSTDIWEEDEYRVYIGGIVGKLREHFLDASFMVFNFKEGEKQSQIASILSDYDMTIMEYPRHYEGCPLLTMEMIHHFLRSSESWLSLGQQNVLMMHCERGGWPILAFMLAALLIYRKQFTGEQKTLDMVFKQAPRELLHLMSPLNPLPSQLRYLQYISRRNVGSHWPPLDRALTLDCIILRVVPNLDGEDGCRPIFRIYGQDPLMVADKTSKVLFSTPKKSKLVPHHNQADYELVKIDIHCHVQGDVVIECISLDCDQEREEMMFRVMFNTAFIRSNILMLNRDEIDTLWNNKDQFSKDFRAEVLFSEMDSTTSLDLIDFPGLEEKDGLPIEAFAKVNEIFNSVDWQDGNIDAARNVLQHLTAIQENLNAPSVLRTEIGSVVLESSPEEVKEEQKAIELENEIKITTESEIIPSVKVSPDTNSHAEKIEFEEVKMAPETTPTIKQSSDAIPVRKKVEPHELSIAIQRPVQPKILVQRRPQTSLSSPVSYCNSLQGSPVPTSRYHSAPSALGITALLQDHPTFTGEEVLRPVTVSLPSSAISSPVTNAPKSVQFSRVSAPSLLPPPTLPCLLHPSNETSTTTENQLCSPPQPSSESCDSSVTQQPEAASRRIPSPPAPPPPSSIPSISGSSVSPIIRSSLSPPTAPPPPPPLPVSSGSFPSPPVKKLSTTLSVSAPSSLQPASCTKTSPSSISNSSLSTIPPPPPAPLPPSFSGTSPCSTLKKSCPAPPSPPPIPGISSCSTAKKSWPTPAPPPLIPGISSCSTVKNSCPTPLPPPLPGISSSATSSVSSPQSLTNLEVKPVPPLPPPPPPPSRSVLHPPMTSVPSPPPPPLPSSDSKESSKNAAISAPVPPPPAPFAKGSTKSNPGVANAPPVPGPPCPSLLGGKGRSISRASPRSLGQAKKSNLKPYHWLKLTRAMQGSLWAEPQKPDEVSKTPEFDMSELESLFSVAAPNSDQGTKGGKSDRPTSKPKPEKVQLIDLRRAYNCEIMLSKVKIPLPDLMSSLLALDDSSLDVDQIDNLIKFCPTKEEMELLKGYTGDKENLGRCEQFFLELMKVPRVESKLRVSLFKLQFHSQVSDLRRNLNIVNSTAEEIRGSSKLKRIMQTILSLGNALNHGTARGSAIGFRLDSLLKLTDTRARNNKMTLMHYLCKVIAEKLPELLDFPKDLMSLEAATKIQLKYLAEEMQAISKGLEKVVQELTASEGDGPVSEIFCTNLKEFLSSAESDVRSLTSLYSVVGRNADALALYFGEDPARCPFEQVVSTLLNFVRMFIGAHEANCKQLEYEKKKAAKEAETEKLKMGASKGESVNLIQNPISSEEVK